MNYFGFFFIFLVFFTVLVVHPHHDNPVTIAESAVKDQTKLSCHFNSL